MSPDMLEELSNFGWDQFRIVVPNSRMQPMTLTTRSFLWASPRRSFDFDSHSIYPLRAVDARIVSELTDRGLEMKPIMSIKGI